MSMYFVHNNLSTYSDNIYKSVFLFKKESDNDENRISDDHIWIKLKDDSIEFFLVVEQIDNPVVVHYHSHLFTLPLDSPDRTDYFLNNGWDKNNGFCPNTEHPYYLTQKSLNEYPLPELKIIHRLFLCLFDELNNSGSDINKYSHKISLQIKSKLEKSSVYHLIRKKYSFYKVLFEWKVDKIQRKAGDVKAFFNVFLDVILKDTIAKVIPTNKLLSGNWFQNPEQELEYLVLINSEYNIDEDSIKNIQNYFLKKHAILSALKLGLEKKSTHCKYGNYEKNIIKKKYSILLGALCNIFCSFFNWIIFLQTFAFLSFSILWLCWLNQIYDYTALFIRIGSISFVLSFVLLFLGQHIKVKKRNDNLFMPRVLVAMAIVLYGIVGSEVILKNQLFVSQETIIVAILVGLLLISFFIYSECRQHSPYYKIKYIKGLYHYKIGPILIYSFNIAVVLVILSQLIVSSRFIDGSKVIYTHLFANEFDNLQYMREHYIVYQEKIEKAREQCAVSLFPFLKQELTVSKGIENATKGKDVVFLKDSVENITTTNQSLYYYNVLKKKLLISDTLFCNDIKSREYAKFLLLWQSDSINLLQLSTKFDKQSTQTIFEAMSNDLNQLTSADSICKIVTDSLKNTYDKYMRSPRNLESLLTYKNDMKVDTVAKFGFYYKSDKVYVLKPFGKYVKIYPMMLMLQVIVIMLVGLVGQLIISDKTVTEPL